VSYSIDTIIDLLKEEGVLLESFKATVTAEQLRRGVDLLHTRDNEITLIADYTCEDQVWQSVSVSCEDPSAVVLLSAGPRIVGAFPVGVRQRLAKLQLVTRGLVVHAVARSTAAPAAAQVTLEIFGWGVTQEMLPTVRAAIPIMDAS
jgi:hypothetical protein